VSFVGPLMMRILDVSVSLRTHPTRSDRSVAKSINVVAGGSWFTQVKDILVIRAAIMLAKISW
jgi:hypothetical protein